MNQSAATKGYIPFLGISHFYPLVPSFIVSLLLSYTALPSPRSASLLYAYARSTGYQTGPIQGSLTGKWLCTILLFPLPPLPTGRPLLFRSGQGRTSIIQVALEPYSRNCQRPDVVSIHSPLLAPPNRYTFVLPNEIYSRHSHRFIIE
jgi:hypothetical protein